MALVWVEPFDPYGTNMALPAQNGYTTVGGVLFAGGRTNNIGLQINGAGWRRALNANASTLGQGIAINPQNGALDNAGGLNFMSGGGGTLDVQCVRMGTDNSVGIYVQGALVGRSVANVLPIGVYNWLECKCIQNTGGLNTGYVEARVNGVVEIIVNGANLPNIFTNVQLGNVTGTNNYDDWIVWDGTGVKNNDFMGDRRLYVSVPNANGVPQNFNPSAGSAFNCINQIPPVDTTYIEGLAAGNTSEFAKGAVGINSNDIAAMVVLGRLFKTDAGLCSGTIGVDSSGFVLNSPTINPGTTGGFFQFIVENDPNGTIPWTKAHYDAANLVINRTV